MDCRKPVFWSLALLGGLTGCTTTGTNTAATPATPAPAIVNPTPQQIAQIDPSLIKKECDLPKKTPTAKMCVLWGNYAADEANGMTNSSVEANDARDRARKAYQQAIKIDPNYLDAYLGLAKLYLALEDDEHAIATLTTASKVHPESGGVWFLLGMVYSKRKSWEPALAYLNRAAQLEPENRTYVDTLGHALAHSGKPEEALKVYMRVNPEAKAYYEVARVMQHRNLPEMSRQYLEMALQKNPQMPEAQQMLTQLNGGNAPTGVEQTSYTPSVENGNVGPALNP